MSLESSLSNDLHVQKSLSKEVQNHGGEVILRQHSQATSVKAPPPDGGWGWVVVFASFMIIFIGDGVAYSFGLFFTQITHSSEIRATKTDASWIGSIMLGMTNGAGPLASVFVNKWGCRSASIVGSLVAAFGFGISYFAQSVVFLYISIGLIGGLGLGFLFLPAVVCVSNYFERRRAFATGIAVCGSGFGTFILAPILDSMIHSLGWRESFIGVVAIFLLGVPFAALYRPLGPLVEKKEMTRKPQFKRKLSTVLEDGTIMLLTPSSRNNDEPPSKSTAEAGDGRGRKNSKYKKKEAPNLKLDFNSASSVKTETATNTAPSFTNTTQSLSTVTDSLARSEVHEPIASSEPLILVPNSDPNAAVQQNESVPQEIKSDAKQPQIFLKYKYGKALDFSLFRNPIFVLFAISNLLTSMGTNVPYVYFPDIASHNLKVGVDDPSLGWLVSCIGIAKTVSRLVMGYLSDKKYVNRLYLYSGSLIVCGIGIGITPHGHTLPYLIACALLFGFIGGIYVGLISVLLVDFLGLEQLTDSFGIILLCDGIGALFGPPIVGLLFDTYQHYLYGFLFAGLCVTLSGAMLLLIPCIQKSQNKRPTAPPRHR